ncbi:MAG: 50S ribosomal protein L6 [Polyangiaceae bacterium]|nr:50S ribosomal protein L6 [Polyangiaceae bacterium]
MTTDAVETTVTRQSRVGKRPIPVPKGVTVTVIGGQVDVQGPKGTLSMSLPPTVSMAADGGVLRIASEAPGSDGPRLQGLARALVANLVRGASEGYSRTLELQGTGYRAELKGRTLSVLVGRSHPCVIDLPPSVTCEVPKDFKGTIIELASPDKALLGQICATIRRFRPAEPYGGKGVRFKGEHVRRKAGKAGKGRK